MARRVFQLLRPCALLLLLLVAPAGCAGGGAAPLGRWEAAPVRAAVETEPWSYAGRQGQQVRTAHYTIRTTIADEKVVANLAQVMEGALRQYRQLVPDVPLSDSPMECYLFGTRREWADYTRRHAGTSATVFLQIMRGGYAVGDRYVAFHIGDVATYSVAAHEGWHQFVARHFIGRLPPFLEEGIACMFEHIRWEGGLPRWNLSVNPMRAHALRSSIEKRKLWPLEQLIGMHAGDIVSLPGDRIEAFYAQNWAFATFLWDGEGQRYRPALQQLLRDAAAGTVHDPSRSHQRAGLPWNPRAVKPMLEHYLGTELGAIEAAFEAWMRTVAYEQFQAQWQS